MKKVQVNTSGKYDVLIGSGLLDQAEYRIERESRVAVITDENVGGLYLTRLRTHLERVGHETEVFCFPPGEGSKNIQTLAEILEWLAQIQITRGDVIIALGGGVTGDLAGFAASIYLRGIDFIQIPTTFLAAIDSSVGGKTAIDLEAGKNLAGSFYQPKQVICDIELLDTLPEANFNEGVAEAIKYGILGDRELFERLKDGNVKKDLEDTIFRCVSMKRDVVEQDEFDYGQRQTLNLGHTFGHCIERLSDYRVSHGNAVAAGLALIANAAEYYGHTTKSVRDEIIEALKSCHLPTTCAYTWEEMTEVMKQDKKRKGNHLTLVLPEQIGTCILKTLPFEQAAAYLKAGLNQ